MGFRRQEALRAYVVLKCQCFARFCGFIVFLTSLLFLCVFLCVASLCQGILPGLGLLLGTLWFSTSVSAMAIGAIESVSIENISEAGVRVSLRVEINSWVSLRPRKKGGHAKDAARHGGANSIEGSYKARISGFRMSPGCKGVSAVQVQHAYQRRQLDLDPTVLIGLGAVNCKLEASFPYSMLIIVLLTFSLQTLRVLYIVYLGRLLMARILSTP